MVQGLLRFISKVPTDFQAHGVFSKAGVLVEGPQEAAAIAERSGSIRTLCGEHSHRYGLGGPPRPAGLWGVFRHERTWNVPHLCAPRGCLLFVLGNHPAGIA